MIGTRHLQPTIHIDRALEHLYNKRRKIENVDRVAQPADSQCRSVIRNDMEETVDETRKLDEGLSMSSVCRYVYHDTVHAFTCYRYQSFGGTTRTID